MLMKTIIRIRGKLTSVDIKDSYCVLTIVHSTEDLLQKTYEVKCSSMQATELFSDSPYQVYDFYLRKSSIYSYFYELVTHSQIYEYDKTKELSKLNIPSKFPL